MRTIAAMIAGLLLSTATFFAGLIIALTYLNAGEPDHQLDGQTAAALWTVEPVAVDKASQSFERLPARPRPKTEAVAVLKKTGTGGRAIKSASPATYAATNQSVDPTTTGAIQTEASATEDAQDSWQNASHVQWCSNRYRSYRAEDNTYQPYGGGRRACQSPYFNVATADPATDVDVNDEAVAADAEDRPRIKEALPEMEQASYQDPPGDYVDGDHVQSCFERYRSYRPEDNSYQPFDGGARRQCE